MANRIHSTYISDQDASVSSQSFQTLSSYLRGPDRSLVFFVGAGASAAGNTNMPTATALLHKILLDGLKRVGDFEIESDRLSEAIEKNKIGFEITLNDFWQICRKATTILYKSLAEFDESCTPNYVHAFLAYWLSTGGIVLTTNYDRLIERAWLNINPKIDVRYEEQGAHSFKTWQEDIKRGGCLFKLHGSLEAPESCLGALEQVTTRLAGNRAEFLAEIIQRRPICFIGWQGIDPDIPPVLSDFYRTRNPAMPIFWMHYEGSEAEPNSLHDAIEKTRVTVKEYASANPILTEANRAFREILTSLAIETIIRPNPTAVSLDFLDVNQAMNQCSAAGVARFVGIAARRAGENELAQQLLEISKTLAQTPQERSEAMQEISLLLQQQAGRKTNEARELLERAATTNQEKLDPWLQTDMDFGILSMTVVGLLYRPWQLLKLPKLFRHYRRSIERLGRETTDHNTVVLHESLYHLYQGRLRLKLFGWLGTAIPYVRNWILVPFDIARSTIGEAGDISIHGHIDVLAYRAVALARLARCQEAREDIAEIDRLIKIFNDAARTEHWERQKQKIEHDCS